MKKLFLFFLLGCSILVNAQTPQNESMEDVYIKGNKREYIRLKGYYRSYQENDSSLKYYRDGIVEYYVRCKDGDIDISVIAERYLRDDQAYRKGGQKTFDLSDNMTARPLPEKKTLLEKSNGKYTLIGDSSRQDIMLGASIVGSLSKDKAADITTMTIDLLAPNKSKQITLFGKTCTLEENRQAETYKYDYEYESLKNLRQVKSVRSYRFDYDKKKISQRITTISELYILEAEYVSKAEKKSLQRETHSDINTTSATNAISEIYGTGITPIDISTLWYYDPANLNKAFPQ